MTRKVDEKKLRSPTDYMVAKLQRGADAGVSKTELIATIRLLNDENKYLKELLKGYGHELVLGDNTDRGY